jgi:hypothetical protein
MPNSEAGARWMRKQLGQSDPEEWAESHISLSREELRTVGRSRDAAPWSSWLEEKGFRDHMTPLLLSQTCMLAVATLHMPSSRH